MQAKIGNVSAFFMIILIYLAPNGSIKIKSA